MASETPHPFNGILAVNKPKGMTSHDVISHLRRVAGMRRIGHAGTLDPMAQGVLVCAFGPATRLMPWMTGLPKEYTGEMLLGAWADTFDTEGRMAPGPPPEDDLPPEGESLPYSVDNPEIFKLAQGISSGVDSADIEDAMQQLSGEIEQTAPPYSAVKVDGKKLYEYARKGERPPRKTRLVRVDRFERLRRVENRVTFAARVSTGTYIRFLVHEVGRLLGCGACMSALVRNAVGAFHIDDAVPLEALINAPEVLAAHLLTPPQALGHLHHLTITPDAERHLRNGHPFDTEDILESELPPPVGLPILVLSSTGDTIAIVEQAAQGEPFRSLRVLPPG